ncbi:hypothetical protein PZB75_00335 [Streptomyces sp. AM 4-1-1]|uniref:hypothetical protein n=1 Tax=Streptomyces sp. AM 4-1-1 TaxID=3028710 RepID=UPI0023B8C731|nr:hypothetical protein [Streptomyces sp. AM 4-1-1]WEH31964.1 hypothetical protein PZB75_00335 [Streptomyces sp. AM 4-1-1]
MGEVHFGDITLGSYNCLPKNSQIVPYHAPEKLTMLATPQVDWLWPSGVRTAFDREVTAKSISSTMPLDAAHSRWEEETKGHWFGDNYNRADFKKAHESWNEWPFHLTDTQIYYNYVQHYGYHSQPWALYHETTFLGSPSAFVGVLVGVAPLVFCTNPVQGKATKIYTESSSFRVSNKTTQETEIGFTIQAGASISGFTPKLAHTFKWSKTTTHTSEVKHTSGEQTTVQLDEGQWGRMEVRACAGVYDGWICYRRPEQGKQRFAAYPMRTALHVPGFASAVTEKKAVGTV